VIWAVRGLLADVLRRQRVFPQVRWCSDGESACRRDSVRPLRAWVAIHLSGLPGDAFLSEGGRATLSHAWPCSGWGLPSRSGHPDRWCALTAPFHPYLCGPRSTIGGLLSVALSCESPRLAVSQHPALRSPDLPQHGAANAARAAATWPTHRRRQSAIPPGLQQPFACAKPPQAGTRRATAHR
jgi:hypothetical protein